jgi:hypothetical protein
MKTRIPSALYAAFSLLAKTTQARSYVCIAVIFLVACTATQVRWDAVKMREDVMVYYNDQIMDNLIRAKNHVPFVHVDIQSLTAQGASQITGTIGAGETRTNMDAPISGVFNTVSRAVMRPFAYSVSPQRSETLTITSAPALGSQALAAPAPAPAPKLKVTRQAETMEFAYPPADNETPTKKSTTTEKTLVPAPQPTPVTIYDLYERFAKGHLSNSPMRPKEGTFVTGTLKKSGTQYYYIANNCTDKEAYYKFCKKLFTKGQVGSLEKQLETTRAEVEALKAQSATPEAP